MSLAPFFEDLPQINLEKDEYLLKQDENNTQLFFLKLGRVCTIKDDIELDIVDEQYAVFNDISVLLDVPAYAAIKCLKPCSFYVINEPLTWLSENPEVLLELTKKLSLRLYQFKQYVTDLRAQYEGANEQLDTVENILHTLLSQQATSVMKRGKSKRDEYGY